MKGKRALSVIAEEIKKDWKGWEKSYAQPYLYAMGTIDSVYDNYFFESGKTIVLYFLSNASSWRGETARRIKKELNQMVK